MVTMALVFIFVVVCVPLGLSAQRWLFKQVDEVCDSEWELYRQRYD